MATYEEMNHFIEIVKAEKGFDQRIASAWVLGYVTYYVPSEKIERAISLLKEGAE